MTFNVKMNDQLSQLSNVRAVEMQLNEYTHAGFETVVFVSDEELYVYRLDSTDSLTHVENGGFKESFIVEQGTTALKLKKRNFARTLNRCRHFSDAVQNSERGITAMLKRYMSETDMKTPQIGDDFRSWYKHFSLNGSVAMAEFIQTYLSDEKHRC